MTRDSPKARNPKTVMLNKRFWRLLTLKKVGDSIVPVATRDRIMSISK
jgi:hypothetical protein